MLEEELGAVPEPAEETNIETGKESKQEQDIPVIIPEEKIEDVKSKIEEKGEITSAESKFRINVKPERPKLPEITDKTKLDVKYALIEPYAYAHIFWDDSTNELVYKIEEPELDEKEKEILNTIETGIEELINISFLGIKTPEAIISFLEKNIKVLLNELGIKVSEESFLRLMYYVYRDFVGLNEIEALMQDYFIEDIECNGVQSPIYIVHRKYRNLRTNIIYGTIEKLTSFVEKLAQKCGKYISYASPVLDAALPDGSRCNATYTQEITSKGPTFTIRKFTKEPWSPIKLMEMRTVSPEILAYLWLLVEHEANIMVIGGTGSGKTTFINILAFFIKPEARIVTIEDSVTGDSEILIKEKGLIKRVCIKEFYLKYNNNLKDIEVLTLNENFKLKFVKPSKLYQHKVNKNIYEITTSTGRKIKITEDHSLFSLGKNGLIEVKPDALGQNKNFIAVPRIIPSFGSKVNEINLLNFLDVFEKEFLCGEPLCKIFSTYNYKDLKVGKSCYQWWKAHNLISVKKFKELNIKFNDKDCEKLKIKSRVNKGLPVLFKIDNEFLEFLGFWLGDGCYDNYNANRVILTSGDIECTELIKSVAKKLNLNLSKMSDGFSLTLNSTVFYKFMKHVLKFNGYSATKRVPDFIWNLSDEQIKHFIKGYFSADGTIKSFEAGCSSQSRSLLNDIQTLFLRLGIISRINSFNRKDGCMELSISSHENISKFKEIGFLQERKNKKLSLIGNLKPTHTVSDIIPLNTEQLNDIHNNHSNLSWTYRSGLSNLGREHLQNIAIPGSFYNDLSHSDILWDKVVKIKKLNKKPRYVYDISVPKHEKFVCSNVLVHNTRELQLMHENWLPSVSRAGMSGGKGEVTLFDLLRASFRQRPDYVIVGEVRGEEAFVLFQGMASGHPSMGTMHADDVETMIRRLETPPINLSPTLVESMDAVVVMTQSKYKRSPVRRVSKVVEVVKVSEEKGRVQTEVPFIWDPRTDKFFFKLESHVFNKLMSKHGISRTELVNEFKTRARLLVELYRRQITGFEEVQKIIHDYYKSKDEILRRFNIAFS